jgi:hypothetical protein
MNIKEIKFDQLYKLILGGELNSYLIIRNKKIDWEPYNPETFYYIERTDLKVRPRRIYTQAIEKVVFERVWMHDLFKVTSVKEKTIVSLQSGLSER